MATKGVRHKLAITLDTCFHEKEGVKLTCTYPKNHSIDSAHIYIYIYILQLINSFFKVSLHSSTTKKEGGGRKRSSDLSTVFFSPWNRKPTYSLFWPGRMKSRVKELQKYLTLERTIILWVASVRYVFCYLRSLSVITGT